MLWRLLNHDARMHWLAEMFVVRRLRADSYGEVMSELRADS